MPETAEGTPLIHREHERLLAEERLLLDRLVALARGIDPRGADLETALVLRQHLEERFLLVIVGEVKAGKSSFINTLLGRDICAVGPTPLTDKIQVLQWGAPTGEHPAEPIADPLPEPPAEPLPERASERLIEEFLVERSLDVELLREVSIVDTPGTNSILRQHSMLTERFIPRADLVLFLTSIDRPLSESENNFLSLIADRWRKKVIFLLTKIDGRDAGDVRTVVDWLRRTCLEHHGFEPMVLPVSAHLQRDGKDGGFDAVRAFIRTTLAAGEKMRLKLNSPLASGQAVLETLGQALGQRGHLLDDDFRAVQDLDRQVEQAGRDLRERAHRHLTEIYDIFQSCEQRARLFFDKHARLKGFSLFKGEKPLKEAFDKEVLDELEAKYTEVVQRTIDWLIKEEIGLYERSSDYLSEKVKPLASDRAIPGEPARFEYRREQVFGSVIDGYRKELAVLDVPGESRRFLEHAESGARQQLLFTVGAIGLGAGSLALVHTFSTLWFNVAGLALAVGIGLTGLAMLPAVRRRAVRQFSEKLDQLVQQVRANFVRAIDLEVGGAVDRLRKAWDPFLLFHRAEASALAEQQRELKELRRACADFQQRLVQPNASVASDPGSPSNRNASDRRFA